MIRTEARRPPHRMEANVTSRQDYIRIPRCGESSTSRTPFGRLASYFSRTITNHVVLVFVSGHQRRSTRC